MLSYFVVMFVMLRSSFFVSFLNDSFSIDHNVFNSLLSCFATQKLLTDILDIPFLYFSSSFFHFLPVNCGRNINM